MTGSEIKLTNVTLGTILQKHLCKAKTYTKLKLTQS